jgi:hypothetical protein
MKLNQKINDAASKIMETITKGYLWYHDTPEQPFEYSEGSIWLINPKTGEWFLELQKDGVLWYDYGTPDSFSKYLNMGRSDFESFIKTWMEDALKRGVLSTNREWKGIQRHEGVEDVLNRGVVSVVRNEINWDDEIKDVLENGTVTTVKLGEWSHVGVGDVIENGNTIKNQEILINDTNKSCFA